MRGLAAILIVFILTTGCMGGADPVATEAEMAPDDGPGASVHVPVDGLVMIPYRITGPDAEIRVQQSADQVNDATGEASLVLAVFATHGASGAIAFGPYGRHAVITPPANPLHDEEVRVEWSQERPADGRWGAFPSAAEESWYEPKLVVAAAGDTIGNMQADLWLNGTDLEITGPAVQGVAYTIPRGAWEYGARVVIPGTTYIAEHQSTTWTMEQAGVISYLAGVSQTTPSTERRFTNGNETWRSAQQLAPMPDEGDKPGALGVTTFLTREPSWEVEVRDRVMHSTPEDLLLIGEADVPEPFATNGTLSFHEPERS